MEVVQRQACRWKEQVKDPNLSTWNFSHLIFDKDTKNKLEKRMHFQQMLLEKLDVQLQKNEIRPVSITFHKN